MGNNNLWQWISAGCGARGQACGHFWFGAPGIVPLTPSIHTLYCWCVDCIAPQSIERHSIIIPNARQWTGQSVPSVCQPGPSRQSVSQCAARRESVEWKYLLPRASAITVLDAIGDRQCILVWFGAVGQLGARPQAGPHGRWLSINQSRIPAWWLVIVLSGYLKEDKKCQNVANFEAIDGKTTLHRQWMHGGLSLVPRVKRS